MTPPFSRYVTDRLYIPLVYSKTLFYIVSLLQKKEELCETCKSNPARQSPHPPKSCSPQASDSSQLFSSSCFARVSLQSLWPCQSLSLRSSPFCTCISMSLSEVSGLCAAMISKECCDQLPFQHLPGKTPAEIRWYSHLLKSSVSGLGQSAPLVPGINLP